FRTACTNPLPRCKSRRSLRAHFARAMKETTGPVRNIGPVASVWSESVDLVDHAFRPVLGEVRLQVLLLDMGAEGVEVGFIDLEALILEELLELGFQREL